MKKVYAVSSSIESPSTFANIFVGTMEAFSRRAHFQVTSEEEMLDVAKALFGNDVYVNEVTADVDTIDLAFDDTQGEEIMSSAPVSSPLNIELDKTIDFDSIIQQEIESFNRKDDLGFPISVELLKSEPLMYTIICMSIQNDIYNAKSAPKH
jgi:hypothetical protein